MQESSKSVIALLHEMTHHDTQPHKAVILAKQLLEKNTLDPATEKSVSDFLKVAQGRVIEEQLSHADEKDKDILISQIIDKYPHGKVRDSFIKLLLDRKVKIGDVEQIIVLANQATSHTLKNEYMEEASLCLFRKAIVEKSSIYVYKKESSYTSLVDFLYACYRLHHNNQSSKDIFISVMQELIKYIDEIESYAIFDEMIKLIVKLEGKASVFAKQEFINAITGSLGICKKMHTWFPFNALVKKHDNPEFDDFIDRLTGHNKIVHQSFINEPVEKITVRGVKKPGVLKIVMLFPGVAKKFFLGKIYESHYRNEEQALRLLNGTCSPKLIASHFEDDVGVIVCEHIEGITLDQVKTIPLSHLQENLERLFTLLHDYGICHGDISYENIIQTKNGDLKLIDFEASSIFSGQVCLDKKNIKQLFDQLGRQYAGSSV